jgi:hypothetical protein
MRTAMTPGARFKQRLRYNLLSRQASLASIHQIGAGFVAQIGGSHRGQWQSFSSCAIAEQAVNRHYDRAMMAFVERQHRRHRVRSSSDRPAACRI